MSGKTKKNQRRTTILAIGDTSDYDSYRKFARERDLILRQGFSYASTSYKRLLEGRLPKIRTERVIVFLFFPFSYWNRHIECKGYRGIYGNHTFFKKFLRFWRLVNRIVRKNLADKDILFVNHPLLCALYRDKSEITKKLFRACMPTPRLHNISDVRQMKRLLDKGHEFYVKPRYGSMGKGITFLSRSSWQTNFIFRNNRIVSLRADRGWRFRDVTGNENFLSKLLKTDVLIQEAVDSLVLRGMKVDLRIYTFFNRILYIYPRENRRDKITTNISQGGRGAPGILQRLPKGQIEKAQKIAVGVSKAAKANFLGIDIALDSNSRDASVIDVNVFPGFPKRRTFNAARSMVRVLTELNGNGDLQFKKGRDV